MSSFPADEPFLSLTFLPSVPSLAGSWNQRPCFLIGTSNVLQKSAVTYPHLALKPKVRNTHFVTYPLSIKTQQLWIQLFDWVYMLALKECPNGWYVGFTASHKKRFNSSAGAEIPWLLVPNIADAARPVITTFPLIQFPCRVRPPASKIPILLQLHTLGSI